MRVTIEGTPTPSTFLGTGQRTTVEYTDFVKKLVRSGFVRVIKKHDEIVSKNAIKPQEEVETTNIEESDNPVSNIEISDQPIPEAISTIEIPHPPTAESTKDVWFTFLKDQGVPVSTRHTKAVMIESWEEHQRALESMAPLIQTRQEYQRG